MAEFKKLAGSEFRISAVIAAAVLVCGLSSGVWANLLTNGNFNDASGTTTPNGWSSYTIDTTNTAGGGGAFTSYKYPGDGLNSGTDGTATDQNAYDGTPYVAFGNGSFTNPFGSEFSGYYQVVAGAPGLTYTATIQGATQNYGYPNANFHLIYFAANGTTQLRTDSITIANYPNQVNGGAGSFSQPYSLYSVATTASPAGTAFVKFEVSLNNGVGTVFVDNASLTAVPEPAILGLVAVGVTSLRRRRQR